MHSLLMSPFSRDFIKTEIDLLKYQQCLNLVNNHLHVYYIHIAPGF